MTLCGSFRIPIDSPWGVKQNSKTLIQLMTSSVALCLHGCISFTYDMIMPPIHSKLWIRLELVRCSRRNWQMNAVLPVLPDSMRALEHLLGTFGSVMFRKSLHKNGLRVAPKAGSVGSKIDCHGRTPPQLRAVLRAQKRGPKHLRYFDFTNLTETAPISHHDQSHPRSGRLQGDNPMF